MPNGKKRNRAAVGMSGASVIRVIDEDIRPWAELAEIHRNVYLNGLIDTDIAGRQQQILHWLDAMNQQTVRIWINSIGGDLFAGIQLFDTIKTLRCRTETVVLGLGASMAGILLQAGTKRLIGPTSHIMLHELRTEVSDATTSKMGENAELMTRLEDKFVDILASRSKLKKKDIRAMWTRKDAWFDAAETVKLGLADGIYMGETK